MSTDWLDQCHIGDCRALMRAMHAAGVVVQTCITSPPYYGLRDYGHSGQIGLEASPDAYIAAMVEVFRCVRNVLADDGTVWLNIGDSYAGGKTGRDDADRNLGGGGNHLGSGNSGNGINRPVPNGYKPKDLLGIPWALAFALRADGWYLRQEIIWHKPNPMPESVTDRCTKAHESIFLLAKNERYYFDADAINEPSTGNTNMTMGFYNRRAHGMGVMASGNEGKSLHAQNMRKLNRNRRSVWTIPVSHFGGAHFAVFPEGLIEPCVLAGCHVGGVVLDPFFGSGTTGAVAQRLGRHYIGCELNLAYVKLQDDRTRQPAFIF